jgi:hypothetical protein
MFAQAAIGRATSLINEPVAAWKVAISGRRRKWSGGASAINCCRHRSKALRGKILQSNSASPDPDCLESGINDFFKEDSRKPATVNGGSTCQTLFRVSFLL